MSGKITIGTGPRGPIEFDLDDYARTGLRVGIFGSSGAGKGWLLGLWLEEMHRLGIPIIAIDPESELWTLKEIGAVVLGGPRADAPLPADSKAVDDVMRFAIQSATPVIFDLGDLDDDAAIHASGTALMRVFHAMTTDLRTRVAFALTEAEVFAPEHGNRGGVLASIQKRGRKRGVVPIIETQRTADISKAAISQCNVGFFGHLDSTVDFQNVRQHIDGFTFAQMKALETGTFVLTTPRDDTEVVRVGQRSVTHGGQTPTGDEVRIRPADTSKALAEMLALLRSAPGPDVSRETSGGVAIAVRGGSAGGGKTQETIQRAIDAGMEEANRRLREATERVSTLEQQALRDASTIEEWRRRAEGAEEGLGIANRAREALAAWIGDVPVVISGDAGPVDDARIIALIRQHSGGQTIAEVTPVEALRSRFLETAAQRLYDRVHGISDDAREALLFLIAHPTFQKIAEVSRGLTGSDSGSMSARWSKAINELIDAGLVVQGGSGRMGRKENVEQCVRDVLAPHEPNDRDIEDVHRRVLWLISRQS